MSRSKRKTPKRGITTVESEQEDKRKANRAFRRINKVQVSKEKETKSMQEISNIWAFGKDGKTFSKKPEGWELRK